MSSPGHFWELILGTVIALLPLINPLASAPTFLAITAGDSHDRLRDIVAQTLATPGPVVCVVKTSADETTAPRVTSEVRPDGTIVSKPMEDMAPFLEREEFAAIMAS